MHALNFDVKHWKCLQVWSTHWLEEVTISSLRGPKRPQEFLLRLRKYLYECTSFWYVNLWYIEIQSILYNVTLKSETWSLWLLYFFGWNIRWTVCSWLIKRRNEWCFGFNISYIITVFRHLQISNPCWRQIFLLEVQFIAQPYQFLCRMWWGGLIQGFYQLLLAFQSKHYFFIFSLG